MLHRLFTFLVALTALCCVSCGDGRENMMSLLDEADSAFSRGDYHEAVRLCNDITGSTDTAFMSWRDYCRVATIYAAAYDHDFDTETSMAAATKCMLKARLLCPDSTAVFVNTLGPELATSLNTVLQTLDGLNTDRSTIGDHEEEGADESEYHHSYE